MKIWQVSAKREQGGTMELWEFDRWWRALLWIVRNLSGHRIIVIVRIED